MSSYISCPPPPATNTNGGSASSQVTRSGPRPPRGLSPSQGETDPLPRRGSLAQGGGPPPPPPKDKPSLPSADEEPPTLPGDIYLHNIREKNRNNLSYNIQNSKKKTCSSSRGGEGCLLYDESGEERRRRG